MRGGVLKYAAQATSHIDAEIGKKDHFWMETNYGFDSLALHADAFVDQAGSPKVSRRT